MLCLPTIMHTGTHILHYDIMRLQGSCDAIGSYIYPNIRPESELPDESYVYAAHVMGDTKDAWLKRFPKYPIITPLRHPARVIESFRRRGEDLAWYYEQWDFIIEADKSHKIYYVIIDDLETRDKQVKELSKMLDQDFHTDWAISEANGSKTNTHDLEITDELLIDVPQWYIDFYEEKRALAHAG